MVYFKNWNLSNLIIAQNSKKNFKLHFLNWCNKMCDVTAFILVDANSTQR